MIFVPGHGFQPLIPGIMSTHVSIVRATGTKHNHATLSEIIVPVTLQGLVLAKGVILVCSMGLVLLPPFRWWKLGPAISTTWVKASIIYLTQKITQRKPLEFQPVPSNFPSMFQRVSYVFPTCFHPCFLGKKKQWEMWHSPRLLATFEAHQVGQGAKEWCFFW